jgi:hypothetical protein
MHLPRLWQPYPFWLSISSLHGGEPLPGSSWQR